MTPIPAFFLGVALWVALAWPFRPDGRLIVPDLAAGMLVAAFASWLMRSRSPNRSGTRFGPARVGWAIVYAVEFVIAMVRANLEVAYRVMHPAMPIRPGIVRVHTTLRTDAARTMLANAITLTPGTMTVDLLADGTMFIHWIDLGRRDREEARRIVVQRFEVLLGRIFE